MIIGGILAGGIGSRMQQVDNIPKQFLNIADVPIIIRTIRAYEAEEKIQYLVIAMNPDWMEYCKALFAEYNVDMQKIILISGGKDRFESMHNITQYCADCWGHDTILVIHDCARPFVSKRILDDNIRMMEQYDMITTSVPTIDTVLISKDGKQSYRVPNRSEIFQDQGPQTYKVGTFLKLEKAIPEDKRAEYMEAGRLYLDQGKRVGIVEGDRMNFKITTDFDLKFAEYLLQNR